MNRMDQVLPFGLTADGLLVTLVAAMAFLSVLAVWYALLEKHPMERRARLLGFAPEALLQLCAYGVFLNFILAVFNLLPVPPLDGSHVVASLLPPRAAYAYRSLGAFGLVIVIVLLMVPGLLGLVFLPAQIATRLVLGAVTSL